jgi:hypothetical protein
MEPSSLSSCPAWSCSGSLRQAGEGSRGQGGIAVGGSMSTEHRDSSKISSPSRPFSGLGRVDREEHGLASRLASLAIEASSILAISDSSSPRMTGRSAHYLTAAQSATERNLWTLESSGLACAAPCPIEGPLNPGGRNSVTRIIRLKSTSIIKRLRNGKPPIKPLQKPLPELITRTNVPLINLTTVFSLQFQISFLHPALLDRGIQLL